MSAATRQRTCAGCGKRIAENEMTDIEPLIDPSIRYVVVHKKCSTFVHHESTTQACHDALTRVA